MADNDGTVTIGDKTVDVRRITGEKSNVDDSENETSVTFTFDNDSRSTSTFNPEDARIIRSALTAYRQARTPEKADVKAGAGKTEQA